MPRSRLIRTAVATATASLFTVVAASPALAAHRDTTPPTAPVLIYAQGYNCGQLIAGMMRSTDNVTPQAKLRYEVFSDGAPIGSAIDQGSESGVWAWLHGVLAPGLHTITVKAKDAAGNWSAPSSGDVVTGYAC